MLHGYSLIKRGGQLVAAGALGVLLSGCGGGIDSASPQHDTTYYLAEPADLAFTITGPTAADIRYQWTVLHYNSDNEVVHQRSLAGSLSAQTRFDEADAQYFRTEVLVALKQRDPILSSLLGSDIYTTRDTVTWEYSPPVEKVGTRIPNAFFVRNQNDLAQLQDINTVEGNLIVDDTTFRTTTLLSQLTEVGGSLILNHSLQRYPSDLNLNGTLQVQGDLAITNNLNLRGLNGLQFLTSIGNLNITNNRLIGNLQGLNQLQSVNGNLAVHNNAQLANLKGLDALTSVAGDLTVRANIALRSTAGAEALEDVGGNVFFTDNQRLQSLEGFSGLSSIGGSLAITHGSGAIEPVGQLVNLNGLQSLISVGGLVIDDLPTLTSLQGLEQLQNAGSQIRLSRLPALTGLSALQNLTAVDILTLDRTDGVTNLHGLENLQTLGTLHLNGGNILNEDNSRLTTLDGLAPITHLNNLYISNHHYLTDISALDNITRIEERAIIAWNTQLCSSVVDAFIANVQAAGGIGGQVSTSGNGTCQ